ncbi:fructose-1-phosphate phosphatase YqaB [bacterium BMS3Bbin02]|nr:fructose-1-phosphate phosphatase YqaB [bacterium BMS3Bbin02]
MLVDSEPLAEEAWAHVLARCGGEVTADDISAVAGTSNVDTYKYFARGHDLPSFGETTAAVDEYLLSALADRLEPFADAVDTVRALAAEGVPLAVASSSNRAELDLKLAKFDLARYFGFVIAGDEVADAKPAPDIYLAAAEGLGVEPRSCVAVEDSVNGAIAAQAAGMRVVLVDRVGIIPASWSTVTSVDAALITMWL